MLNTHKRAFTLVELIVVIIILAILGTISFMALQGYSSKARDSKRLSDISNIKTSLELFSLNTGYYPLPDDPKEVSYSGELLWTQGVVGKIVTTNLSRNIQKTPQNPFPEGEYTYSTINTQKKYELLSVYESELVSYDTNLLNTTTAASANYPKIDGTYNGLFIKAKNYYVPTPSLITSEDLSLGLILDEINITSQIITGGDNLPLIGVTEGKTKQLNITLSVYNGIITQDSTPEQKQTLVEAIQGAYETSTLANTNIYKSLLNTTKASDIELFVETMVLDNGTTSLVIKGDCTSGTIMGSTYDTVEYSYGEIFTGETASGTTIVEGDSIAEYTSTITCDDGEVSISDEIEDIISLYTFNSHTFTNCGQTGYTGPALSTCRSNYDTTWDSNTDFFNMNTNGIQEWTVPTDGTYRIETAGAKGGQGTSYTQYIPGSGVKMKGDFNLIKGDIIKILVGQIGLTGGNDGGGGGGTYVTQYDNTPLIISGGGGGSSYSSSANGNAVTGTSGTAGYSGGSGGSNGAGGVSAGHAGAGAGLSLNGGNGPSTGQGGGYSFVNGGNGGTGPSAHGGFGGGGGTHGGGRGGGGGGGYSGGGASSSSQYGGGGGGSYNSGANKVNGGLNSGHGSVVISKGDQTSCEEGYELVDGFCEGELTFITFSQNSRSRYLLEVLGSISFNTMLTECNNIGKRPVQTNWGCTGYSGRYTTTSASDPISSCHPTPNGEYINAIPSDATIAVTCGENSCGSGNIWTGTNYKGGTSTYRNASIPRATAYSGFLYSGTTKAYILCTD